MLIRMQVERRKQGHTIELLRFIYTQLLHPWRSFSVTGSRPISDRLATDRFLADRTLPHAVGSDHTVVCLSVCL